MNDNDDNKFLKKKEEERKRYMVRFIKFFWVLYFFNARS